MVAMLTTLAGCAISTPFRGPGYDAESGVVVATAGTVYVSVTRATYTRDKVDGAGFWDHVELVEKSLYEQPGFIGYSKRREVLGNNAWTLTVWTDEASMRDFVTRGAHRDAVSSAGQTLEGARFRGFVIAADQVPVPWPTALERLGD